MQGKKHINTWPLLLAVFLLALLALLGVGTANARLERSMSEKFTLTYKKNDDQVYLLGAERTAEDLLPTDGEGNYLRPSGWEPLRDETGIITPNAYRLDFLLANSSRPDAVAQREQLASLEVFTTLGVADPAAVTITLQEGGSEYMAVPTEVMEGSAWYKLYGPGWVYRFYNGAGEERNWSLRGGELVYRKMTMIVTGSSQAPTAFTLIATARPE